jgi:hypothetical protein
VPGLRSASRDGQHGQHDSVSLRLSPATKTANHY